jgi:hypothetical protein
MASPEGQAEAEESAESEEAADAVDGVGLGAEEVPEEMAATPQAVAST